MKLVYVAGPFTGSNAWEIERNIRHAEDWGYLVSQAGAWPVIPHSNTRFFHGSVSEQMAYDGTMEMMRRCDAVVVAERHGVSGRFSTGVQKEIEEAMRLGLPILSDDTHWAEAMGEATTVRCIRAWLKYAPRYEMKLEDVEHYLEVDPSDGDNNPVWGAMSAAATTRAKAAKHSRRIEDEDEETEVDDHGMASK